jgi:hypothetical protein
MNDENLKKRFTHRGLVAMVSQGKNDNGEIETMVLPDIRLRYSTLYLFCSTASFARQALNSLSRSMLAPTLMRRQSSLGSS